MFELRDTIRRLDAETDYKYDLVGMYEATELSEPEKKLIATMIADAKDPEEIAGELFKIFNTQNAMNMDEDCGSTLTEDVEEEIQDGDEIVYNGEHLFVTNADYMDLGKWLWVTDNEEDRYNKKAPGWSLDKELVDEVIGQPDEEELDESLKDFMFTVKCNDGPKELIKVVAEDKAKAEEYAKKMYAQNHTTYADDRHNIWSIEAKNESLSQDKWIIADEVEVGDTILLPAKFHKGIHWWKVNDIIQRNPQSPVLTLDLEDVLGEKYKAAIDINDKVFVYTPDDKLTENLSGTMSVEDIAKKHNVDADVIRAQVDIGKEVEKEHTDNEDEAVRIALDHLFEMPDYYDKLKKMEKGITEGAKGYYKFEIDLRNSGGDPFTDTAYIPAGEYYKLDEDDLIPYLQELYDDTIIDVSAGEYVDNIDESLNGSNAKKIHRFETDNLTESKEDTQYGVHSFSQSSIIFRGTEEECAEFIADHNLWDDAEIYAMTPDDPHYLKEAKDDSLKEASNKDVNMTRTEMIDWIEDNWNSDEESADILYQTLYDLGLPTEDDSDEEEGFYANLTDEDLKEVIDELHEKESLRKIRQTLEDIGTVYGGKANSYGSEADMFDLSLENGDRFRIQIYKI